MVFQLIMIAGSISMGSSIVLFLVTLYYLHNGFTTFSRKCYALEKNGERKLNYTCV